MENLKPTLSICIPCYEMHKSGVTFLDNLLQSIATQLVSDDQRFRTEIVISDHSEDDKIEKLVDEYIGKQALAINYVRNSEQRGSSSHNINNCIKNSKGDYIKPIFQDDYFSNNKALATVFDVIDNNPTSWVLQSYHHYHLENGEHFRYRTPHYNTDIQSGNNTIGPPSCVVFPNDNNLFDENLIWYMDIEFYHRMFIKYGEPLVIQQDGIVNTLWGGQVTNTRIDDSVKKREQEYILKKLNVFEQKVFVLKRHPTAAIDIREHLDILTHYTTKCETVVEMGMRSIVSTWAFLAGKPKKMVSVDISHPDTYSFIPGASKLEEVESLCRQNGIDFEFKLSDSRTVDISECDLLFIDTLHDEDQIREEIRVHKDKVRKYIIFHDTTTFETIGESKGEPGIWKPIEELLKDPNWKLVRRFTNNNGLTIIERCVNSPLEKIS
jgi:glycosyltransferase involved in cell wall biosynthesis